MMEITIRKVLHEEAYEYTSCHISCWQSAYEGIMSDEYLSDMAAEQEQRTEWCKKALSTPGNTEFFCVMYKGRMIGRLIIGESRDDDKPDAGEIAAIYLIKEFWDKGYGRKMMDFALETLKRRGYDEVILWVLEKNLRARHFYEKCNFVFDGRKKEIHIDKPLIEVRYVLKLC